MEEQNREIKQREISKYVLLFVSSHEQVSKPSKDVKVFFVGRSGAQN